MATINIGAFNYNPDSAELSQLSFHTTLDSRQQAILNYFIEHPNRIISRDELQNEIWQGTIVTDNAISKSIANLRKVFNDDSKAPQYIQTVPKKGYKFIASISDNAAKDSAQTDQPPTMKARIIGSVIALVMMAVMLVFLNKQPDLVYGDYRPLNTTVGAKTSLLAVPQSNQFLFINFNKGGGTIWLQATTDTEQKPIKNTTLAADFKTLLGVTPEYLTLLAAEDGLCGIYQTALDLNTLTMGKVLKQKTLCDKFVVHDIVAYHDKFLFLGHGISEEHMSRLYEVSFDSEPKVIDLGIESGWIPEVMDLSDNQQKLLLTTYNDSEQTRWYEYHFFYESLTQLNQISGISKLAVWSHRPGNYVYSSSDNGFKLLQQSVDSEQPPQLLANLTQFICCEIERLNDKQNYLFTSYDKVMDLHWLNDGPPIANSNVRDRNPQLLHHSDNMAFFSDRTGKPGIYLSTAGGDSQMLDIPLTGIVLSFNLANNDKQLSIVQPHRLWLYNLEQQAVITNTFVADTLTSSNWLSDTLLAASFKQKKRQGVKIFNNQLQQIAELNAPWRTVVKDRFNDAVHYYVDTHNKLYQFPASALLENPQPKEGKLLGELAEHQTIVAEKGRLYIHNHFTLELNVYSLSPFEHLEQGEMDSYLGFDVKDEAVIYTHKRSFESNIYRTDAKRPE